MDLQTLDAYIDSLRDELDETTLKSKTNFTLDMISQFKKTKCCRKFMGDHYIFLPPSYHHDYYDDPDIVQIKFKSEIISIDKLLNIYLGSSFWISLRIVILESILNKTCIIDGSNLYFINKNYCEVLENNTEDESLSIIDEVWYYKSKFYNLTYFKSIYYIKDTKDIYRFTYHPSIGLVINFNQLDEISVIESVSYIIITYELEIDDEFIKKETRLDMTLKDKINMIGNYYWIKNIFKTHDFIEKIKVFSGCFFSLYSDLDVCIDDYYSGNFYFIYNN